MRGVDQEGQVANYVETEQIIEYQGDKCSFIQVELFIRPSVLPPPMLIVNFLSSSYLLDQRIYSNLLVAITHP